MTLQLSSPGNYVNSADITDNPAVIISSVNVNFTNFGRLFSTSDASPVITGSVAGINIDNTRSGFIAAANGGVAILGTSGSDSISNGGTISGSIALGEGDDSFRQYFTESSQFGFISELDGGNGIDSFVVDGAFSSINGYQVSGFERLTFTTATGLNTTAMALSGFSYVTTAPGANLSFIDCANPNADLYLTGGFFTLVRSPFARILGSSAAEALFFRVNDGATSVAAQSVVLEGGDDKVFFELDFTDTSAAFINCDIDFGSGTDTLIVIDRFNERTVDLAGAVGLEIISDGGNPGNDALTLKNGNSDLRSIEFLGTWLKPGRTLTLDSFASPNAALDLAGAYYVVTANSEIGSAARPLLGQLYENSPVNRFSDTTLVNDGHILGEVKFVGGFDCYDGRNGSAGGAVSGYAGDDILLGGSSIDRFLGGDGNDTLDGGAGADVLDGGAGDDRIVYDAGDLASNVTGGSGVDTLVVSGNVLPTSFNLSAQGFEAAEQNQVDAGGQSWSSIQKIYTPGWTLLQQTTINDDASKVIVDFDLGNTQSYASQLTYFDTVGHIDFYDVNKDDGSRVIVDLDQNNTQAWTSLLAYFDAQGRVDFYDLNIDNGLRVINDVDQTNAQSWTSQLTYFDAQGRVDFYDLNIDNGLRVINDVDQTNAQSWTSQLTYFDAQRRVDFYDLNIDNGLRVINDVDQTNAQSWTSQLTYFDAQGRVDFYDVNNDNGTRAIIDMDQDNSQTWDRHVTLYAADHITVLQEYFV